MEDELLDEDERAVAPGAVGVREAVEDDEEEVIVSRAVLLAAPVGRR